MTTKPLTPPFRALWELTWRCDLACGHCLVTGGANQPGTLGSKELATHQALDLVHQLADLGVSAVSLTGGEPFLRSDWAVIAQEIKKRGMKLRFASNGHLITRTVIQKLIDLKTESISVSIDGLKEIHDAMRASPSASQQSSSFDRVLASMARIVKADITLGVITTVTKQNLAQLPQIHELLKTMGVKRWLVQLAHRSGRLSSPKQNCNLDNPAGLPMTPMPITPSQLPQVAGFITQNAADPVLQPKAFNSIGYLSRKEPIIRQSGRKTRNPIWNGCKCGISVIGIEPDGGIKGCANQVGDPFVVGNIQKEKLSTIWHDRPRWHWLNPTPDKFTGACATCRLSHFCHAGCTVLAYRSSGALFNNPFCLRREEHKEKKNLKEQSK